MSKLRKESLLHHQLKILYGGKDGQTEVQIGPYICDCITSDNRVIEIQLGSFGPLKQKAAYVSNRFPLLVVHPIISRRLIEVYSVQHTLLRSRTSPRKGSPWDLFSVLIHSTDLIGLPQTTLELLSIDIKEKRIDDGQGSWRRKGVRLVNKELLAVHESIQFSKAADFLPFIPFDVDVSFTTRDFYTACIQRYEDFKITSRIATVATPFAYKITYPTTQRAVYVLWKLGIIKRIGKQGTRWLYRRF
ncbi:MAG: hypothetical protein SNJ56_02410 [Termitinemataceae bacterium]